MSTSKTKNDDIAGAAASCRIAADSSDRPNLLIHMPTPYPNILQELAKTAVYVFQPYQDEVKYCIYKIQSIRVTLKSFNSFHSIFS